MKDLEKEIASAISQLKRRGEFEALATDTADDEALATAIRFGLVELSDKEVEQLVAQYSDSSGEDAEAIRVEVRNVIRRLHESRSEAEDRTK